MLKMPALAGPFLLVLSLALAQMATAATDEVRYQARLTDLAGDPLPGPVDLRFRLFDAENGGNLVWAETLGLVPLSDGLLDVTLGKTLALEPALSSAPMLWLEVEVDFDTLSPRQPVGAVPFAIRSEDADRLGGLTVGEITLDLQGDVGAAVGVHAAIPDAHHDPIAGFADLAGQASDAQIPGGIARDVEVLALQTLKADLGHGHDGSYYTQAQVDALIAPLLARLAALETLTTDLDARVVALESADTVLDELAPFVSVSGSDIFIDGANLHLTNGQGATDSTNGLGNLIVGYNAPRSGATRTGSHNLVVGDQHDYRSYGGFVAGFNNTLLGSSSTIAGGRFNEADGVASAVMGGRGNKLRTLSTDSIIVGGRENVIEDDTIEAVILGGHRNSGFGLRTAIVGGSDNSVSGSGTAVLGGQGNSAGGFFSTMLGGESQIVVSDNAIGGSVTTALDGFVTVEGDTVVFEGVNLQVRNGSGGTTTANGLGNLILGYNENHPVSAIGRTGSHNLVVGHGHEYVSTGGVVVGRRNRLRSALGFVFGEDSDAFGDGAGVFGGRGNRAVGDASTISGGRANRVELPDGYVGGGRHVREVQP